MATTATSSSDGAQDAERVVQQRPALELDHRLVAADAPAAAAGQDHPDATAPGHRLDRRGPLAVVAERRVAVGHGAADVGQRRAG